ncbi:hypothetical protein C2I27_07955 [Priestia megaterium]|uniref:DUF7674 family protein n=1 Tax=Priestia TaxID=2800373 RepID=UPI000D51E8CB|nr:hypothetical protein [Priestia megaterium]MBU8852051.1 hypothetical protein [Bacillus sp. FJAT-26377]PVC72289.1 hypothetical protein C2I27_07955 [Priestia megaterium]TPF17234.1 hypothetical protein CBE78_13345 [Priestia megaterium]TPF23790.1 hypothetical protein CBE79_13285 [Priestia megaterium]
MITKQNVIPLLKEACPSFEPSEEVDLNDKDELQHELSRVAGHLISLEYNGQLEREPDVFEAIEQLYIEGEADVKEAVTTGLFQAMHEMIIDQQISPEEIGMLLKPHSLKWWKTIDHFSENSGEQ